jgi:superfamily I DNA and RNA helicase
LLVDEGQDLPPAFYRLALRSLKTPKRLYWAYDEAQGIGSLVIPNAAVVFGEEGGRPIVDLSSKYEGGITKSHVFRRCYRSPGLLLMVAHALNIGLLRIGGPLQGITTQTDWTNLGYEVSGSFRRRGAPVVLRRRSTSQAHPIDRDSTLAALAGPPLVVKTFRSESDEAAWVAHQVATDLERGLQPADILVTALGGDYEKEHFERLRKAMKGHKVAVWEPGLDPTATAFRQDGQVTLAKHLPGQRQ